MPLKNNGVHETAKYERNWILEVQKKNPKQENRFQHTTLIHPNPTKAEVKNHCF